MSLVVMLDVEELPGQLVIIFLLGQDIHIVL